MYLGCLRMRAAALAVHFVLLADLLRMTLCKHNALNLLVNIVVCVGLVFQPLPVCLVVGTVGQQARRH